MSKTLSCNGMPARLIEARTASGLSANALAQRCDLAPATVRRVELGFNVPALDTVEILARVLGVSPAWLGYGAGPSREIDAQPAGRERRHSRGRFSSVSAVERSDASKLRAKLTALVGVLDEQTTPDSDLPRGRLTPARRLAGEALAIVDKI